MTPELRDRLILLLESVDRACRETTRCGCCEHFSEYESLAGCLKELRELDTPEIRAAEASHREHLEASAEFFEAARKAVGEFPVCVCGQTLRSGAAMYLHGDCKR